MIAQIGHCGHVISTAADGLCHIIGGTAGAAPPPFRPGNPALCGSYPLVTPYYYRLGDLLCFVIIVSLLYFFSVNCVIYVCLHYFDTVGWVLRPVKKPSPV